MIRRRRFRQALGVLALGALALVWSLRTERAGEWACAQLRERLPVAVGANVSIARCEIEPLTLSVRLRTVAITDREGGQLRATADEAALSLRGFFLGGVDLDQVTLVHPRVTMELPDSPAARTGACPLDALKRVRVRKLEIQDGMVQLTRADGRWARLDGVDVKASLTRRSADIEATVRGGAAAVAQDRLVALGRTRLAATLDVEGRVLDLQQGEFNVEGATAAVTGQIESLCDPVPQLALSGQLFVPLPALARLGVPLDQPGGQLWSRVAVSGRADSPTVRAEVQAAQVTLGRFTPGDFSARLAWSGTTLLIEQLTTRVGEGTVLVSGEAQLTEGLPVKLTVDVSNASFARALERAGTPGSWVEFPATLKGAVSGHLLPAPELGGDLDFRTGQFSLASRAWNAPVTRGRRILAFSESVGSFRLALTAESASFENLQVNVGAEGHTRVSGAARLHFDQRRGLEVRVAADAVDLADFGSIAELPWQGAGSATVTVTGPYSEVVADAQLSLRDFKFDHYDLGTVQGPLHYAGETLSFPAISGQRGRSQYFGGVDLIFAREGLWTRASVRLPDGRVEDIVDLLLDLSPSMQNVLGVLTGRVSAVASFDSPARALTGRIALQVGDVEFLQRRLGSSNGMLRFEKGETLVLEPCVFDGPLGRFFAGGTWDLGGPLDFKLALEHGSLKELIDPQGLEGLAVGGEFTSQALVGGDSDVIKLKGSMSSAEVSWKGRSLGPMHLDLEQTARDVAISGTVIGGVKGSMTLKARNEWPFEATLGVDLPDATAFLPASAGNLSLALSGVVTAAGPMKLHRDIRATARLDKVAIARGEVSATNQEPVELAYNAGAFEVRSLSLKGPTTEIAAEGSWGPATVDVKTRGSVDLRLLSSFAPEVERTSGRLDFTAAFSGPVKNPTLIGAAELNDARLSVKGQDLNVRGLTGRADFSESRILIQDVQGFLNDGRLRARGDVRLDHLSLGSLGLQVDLEDVTVRVRPELPVTLTGALLVAQKNGRTQLSGALDLVKFHYTQPLALDSVLASAGKKGVPQDEKPTEWLWLDVDLSAGDDVRVENNLARAKLQGKLKLTGTNVKPVLVGAIEAGEGSQAFFRGNTYSVGRALLQFNGLWPTFDLSAQTQVRAYLVSVKAFGKLEDPKVSLTSEPALSEADILSLITVGATARESVQTQSGAGLAAEALLSASGLDQQVQKFLQRSVGLKDQQVRLTTSFNEATGTAEPSVSWESKVTDKLKVGVTQPVTGKGTKLQAEWHFNQRVSVRGQWDNIQSETTTVGNPGAELRFRFEWE